MARLLFLYGSCSINPFFGEQGHSKGIGGLQMGCRGSEQL